MLNRVEAGLLMASHAYLKTIVHKIYRVIDEGKASRKPGWAWKMQSDEIDFVVKALKVVGDDATRLKFQGIPTACNALSQELIHRVGLFDLNALDHFHSNLATIIAQLPNALDESTAFILSVDSAHLLAEEHPFGKDVSDAFPSAAYDIQEAARCRVFERWTAGVLHLMRALETPILALQADVKVSVPKDQWGGMIDQIEKKIREMAGLPHDKATLQWLSEAAAHFRVIKDAWRNFAMHGKDSYDQTRASNIYDSVRAFTQHLATRLKE